MCEILSCSKSGTFIHFITEVKGNTYAVTVSFISFISLMQYTDSAVCVAYTYAITFYSLFLGSSYY